MEENKKISVIIMANNNTEKCLENIFKQSYIKDIEIVVFYKDEKYGKNEKNQKDKQEISNQGKEHNESQNEINAIEEYNY